MRELIDLEECPMCLGHLLNLDKCLIDCSVFLGQLSIEFKVKTNKQTKTQLARGRKARTKVSRIQVN